MMEKLKKQIFDVILDKISLLSWNEIKANKFLFEFLKAALKTESVSSVKTELFSIILNRTFVTEHLGISDFKAILSIINAAAHAYKGAITAAKRNLF